MPCFLSLVQKNSHTARSQAQQTAWLRYR